MRISRTMSFIILITILASTGCISTPAQEAFESGNRHVQNGDLDKAIADYDRAIELDPDWALAYNNRALAYIGEEVVTRGSLVNADEYSLLSGSASDLDKAIADLDRAIELEPDNSMFHFNRGLAYSMKGDDDQAIVDYDRAIDLNSDDPVAYERRASSYMIKGDLDQSIADYDRAADLAPDYAEIYNGRSMAYWLKGDLDQSIADLDRLINLAPDNAQAYFNRGVACVEIGETDRAIADFREFWRLSDNPDDRRRAEEELALLGATP